MVNEVSPGSSSCLVPNSAFCSSWPSPHSAQSSLTDLSVAMWSTFLFPHFSSVCSSRWGNENDTIGKKNCKLSFKEKIAHWKLMIWRQIWVCFSGMSRVLHNPLFSWLHCLPVFWNHYFLLIDNNLTHPLHTQESDPALQLSKVSLRIMDPLEWPSPRAKPWQW